jgi:hypothetical protein
LDAPKDLMPIRASSREEVVHLMRAVLASRLRSGLPMPPTQAEDERPSVRNDRVLHFVAQRDVH